MDTFYKIIVESINIMEGASNIFSINDIKGNIHIGAPSEKEQKGNFLLGSEFFWQKSVIKKENIIYDVFSNEQRYTGLFNKKENIKWIHIINTNTISNKLIQDWIDRNIIKEIE